MKSGAPVEGLLLDLRAIGSNARGIEDRNAGRPAHAAFSVHGSDDLKNWHLILTMAYLRALYTTASNWYRRSEVTRRQIALP